MISGEIGLKIKEDRTKGIYIDKLTSIPVVNEEEILELVQQANKLRIVAETSFNLKSSRSHTIFMISLI